VAREDFKIRSCAAAVVIVIGTAAWVGCSRRPSESVAPPAPVAAAKASDVPSNSSAHQVTGRVPRTTTGYPAIVILEPREHREFPAPAQSPVMDQVSLTFVPNILFVRTGQPVLFRSNDSTLHNVNVKEDATNAQAFNVVIPPGATFSHTFKEKGFYNVGCDIHSAMSATIIATSTPYTALAEEDGTFALPDVDPGAYTLTVYAGAEPIVRNVDVQGPRTQIVIEGPALDEP
jgi:plastocyanin